MPMPTEILDNLFGLMPTNGAQPDAFLSHLLDLSDAGIFAHAFDGQMLMVNAAWEQALEKPRHEVVGRHYLESVGEEAAAHLTGRTRRLLQTGEPQTVEFALNAASGKRWFRVNLFPVRNPDGEIKVIGGIAAEITEYRETQETLSDATRRAWNLAAISPAITYIFDLDERRTVYLNRVPQQTGTLPLSEPPTEAYDFFAPVLHPDDLPRFDAHLAHLREAKDDEFQTFEYRALDQQEAWRWYLSRDRVYARDADGTPTQIIGCAVDISERRQLEAANADLIERTNHKVAELNSLIEIIPAGVYIGNPSGIFAANSPGLSLLGFDSMDDLKARYTTLHERLQVCDPETRLPIPPEENDFLQALAGRSSSREVLYRNVKTGAERRVHAAAAPITENGEVVAAVGVITDITESVRLREELFRSSELLNALIASASDLVYVKDRDGRFLLINPPAAALMNTTPQEALGKRDADFLPPDIVAIIERNDAAVMAGGVTVVNEEPIPMRDGLHIFLSTKDPLRDANGAVIGLVGLSQDITERKRIEAALQDSKASLQIALEAGQMGAWQWDIVTDTLDASEIFRQTYGFGADTALKYAMKLERIPAEDLTAVQDALQRSLAEHSDFAMEHRVVSRNGAVRWVAVRGRLFYGEDGQPTRMIGASQDITERRTREAELDALNTRLQRAMQETHHRIKNNLQVISALTEMQEANSDGTVPLEALRRIGQHARTLAGLHDLLTIQAARNAEEDTLWAEAVLAKLVPMLEMTSGGRPIHYESDAVLLSQRQSASFAMLVSELISNAIKHGTGLIEITLRVVPAPEALSESAPNTHICLEVCDDGAGFPADFDPKKAANTGLELIESVGKWDLRGSVKFLNRAEGGARVVVVFPQEETAP